MKRFVLAAVLVAICSTVEAGPIRRVLGAGKQAVKTVAKTVCRGGSCR